MASRIDNTGAERALNPYNDPLLAIPPEIEERMAAEQKRNEPYLPKVKRIARDAQERLSSLMGKKERPEAEKTSIMTRIEDAAAEAGSRIIGIFKGLGSSKK